MGKWEWISSIIQRKIYSLISRRDGIKAREIGVECGDINRLLYSNPFVHDLCYRDDDHLWHGLIWQGRLHTGLADFCGYYGSAERFLAQPEAEWLDELEDRCIKLS